MQANQIELLVIQPTPFCNLNCSYCYLPSRQVKGRMSFEILEKLLDRVFASPYVGKSFSIVWHAGEPMALPVSYYREAFRLIDRRNTRGIQIHHSFQSNATLISTEWCQFIKQYDIGVGVSIDGPAFLHDRNRKTRSGGGSLDKARKGMDLLRTHGVPFHIISVLTDDSLDYPDELFDFYLEVDTKQVAFNIEEVEGINRKSSLSGAKTQNRVTAFYSRFFDINRLHGFPLSIREFDSATAALLHGDAATDYHPQQVTPFRIISVDYRGRFSTFSPELLGMQDERFGGFTFGDVSSDDLACMETNPCYLRAKEEIEEGVRKCRATCDYFAYCGGGAPVNKLYENGSFATTETMFCRLTKKALCDVIGTKLLERYETNQALAR